MRILKWLFKAIAYLAAAGVMAIVAYVFLMSGIFHTPRSFFEPATYQPPGDAILIVGGTKGAGLEIVRELVAWDHATWS